MRKFTALAAVMTGAVFGLAAVPFAQEAKDALTDQDFVAKAASSGATEVTLGKMAAERGASEQVKKYGRQMVTDHTRANEELLALAGRKQIAVPKAVDPKHQGALDRLNRLRGAEFDKAYAEQMVKDHREAVSLFESESKQGQDAELKALAAKTLPTLREHLRMAQDLPGGGGADRK